MSKSSEKTNNLGGTSKHVNLGRLKERVDRVAERDGSLATTSAVIREAVSRFLDQWDLLNSQNPSTRA